MTPPAPICTPFDQPLYGSSATTSDRTDSTGLPTRQRAKRRRGATWLPTSRRTRRRGAMPDTGP